MRMARTLWLLPLLALGLLVPVRSEAIVTVVFGSSWDGASNDLQHIVDARYGAGAITVTTDYIGAHPGDADPFGWKDLQFDALLVKEIAGNADRNTLGWYKETGSAPVIDGTDDGVVFDGPASAGAAQLVVFPTPTPFGLYLNPNGPDDATNAPEPEKFYTNRRFNDLGPDGSGALHEPFDGDVQALVFDLSGVLHEPNVWLVAFEDLDSGANPGPCCSTTDNDFNDLVLEVHAIGATPAGYTTFGRIKAMYR